jgi:hypothetical protein
LKSDEIEKVVKGDIIIYSHIYNCNIGINTVAIVIDVYFNFWLCRQEYTIFSNNEIKKVIDCMITYRKI